MSNFKNKSLNSFVDDVIVFFFFVVFLSFKSIKTLLKIFTYGVFKNEILTTNSEIGFDMKIKIK
tara:strand:+ start:612 stop:803 length:192 start_codon:yes stop_codon:yes gene_type:complete